MSLVVEKSPLYHADVTSQFEWYFDNAGEEQAWRFFNHADATLVKLARQPNLGRLRNYRLPLLRGLRSYRVDPPFDKLLIFYRLTENSLVAWRLMHGARDLPRRLAEPPIS